MATQNNTIDQERTVFKVLMAICICHLLNDSMQSILPAVFPMIKDTFHLSFVQVGAISLVIQLTSSLIQPWVGLYADKHRHSWQLSVAMVFSMCGVVMLALATSYWMILLAVGLMGVGSAVFHPQAAQIAQAASGGRKGFHCLTDWYASLWIYCHNTIHSCYNSLSDRQMAYGSDR